MNSTKKRKPIFWVPTVYFAMGIPFIALSLVSTIMFKDLGVSNEEIAYWTSLLTLPWSLKWLFSPIMETFGTKKRYIVLTEIISALLFGLIIFALPLTDFFKITLALMAVIAISGSIHDIAGDGVYMQELDTETQSVYSGWQGAFYNMAKILANGGLVFLAGWLTSKGGFNQIQAWQSIMVIFAIIMAGIGLYHIKFLPQSQVKNLDKEPFKPVFTTMIAIKIISFLAIGCAVWFLSNTSFIQNNFYQTFLLLGGILLFTFFLFILMDIFAPSKSKETKLVFKEFFKKKYIGLYLIFIFLYRFAEGLAMKIAPIFLKDNPQLGGIGLSNEQYGLIYGTFGAVAFVLGSILAGYYISRFGLKKVLFSLVCIFNIPFVVYLLFAIYQPYDMVLIATGIIFEYFSYGFGFVGLILFMMQQIAPGKYQMAHYAIANSLMNLGVMIPGMISGYLSTTQVQKQLLTFIGLGNQIEVLSPYLGYELFFILVMIMTLPAILITKFVPFTHDDSKN